MQLATCIDYSMSQLSSYIKVLDIGNTTYAFAVNPKGQPFVHPRFNSTCALNGNNTNSECLTTTLALEMYGASESETEYFNNTIIPILVCEGNLTVNCSETVVTDYKDVGKTIIIGISPVYSNITFNKTVQRVATVSYRIEERIMTDPFNSLKSSLYQLLYIEGFALGVLMGVILICC